MDFGISDTTILLAKNWQKIGKKERVPEVVSLKPL
jgi:hypothetical protein